MMRAEFFLGLLLAGVSPAFAADPPGFAIWTPESLQQIDSTLAGQKSGSKTFQQLGSHRPLFSHREASGTPELHEIDTDLYVIQSGKGSIIVGGRMLGAKKVAEHEIKGTGIEGGTVHEVTAGDIIHIPANTPHQFVVPARGKASYFVMKIPN